MEGALAIVTGGGRGIGASTSFKLASAGYRVLLTYNNNARSAEKTVEEIRNEGGDAVAIKVDCSDYSEIELMVHHPWTAEGVDVLVLNHGIYERVAASELDPITLRDTIRVNLEGAHAVWWKLRNHIIEGARIVAVGSQLGIRGSAHGADYSASKAGLHAWARSLALDLAPRGIRVNIVAPGFVDTAILKGDSKEKRIQRESEVPLGRIAEPEEIASCITFLASPASSYVTGAVLHVNGGLYLP